jgi:intein/homing endonuclease
MNTDGTIQSLSLASFVEQYEFGATTGIKVKSLNISTGEVTWNIVSDAAKTATVTELIEIEDESGKIIRCTPDHQIYTKNRGYVKAGELLETDVLCVES